MLVFSEKQELEFKTDLIGLIPHMRAFARSLCRNAAHADDLAQEALAKAWQAREGYQPGTNLKAWVFMIIRNAFLSQARRSWRTCELDPTIAEQTLVSVSDPTSAIELNDLRRAMNMLPQEQNEALVLVGAAGLSYEEAAQLCGVAIGTIKSRVSRARVRLAQILEDGDLADDGLRPHLAMASILERADKLRAA